MTSSRAPRRPVTPSSVANPKRIRRLPARPPVPAPVNPPAGEPEETLRAS